MASLHKTPVLTAPVFTPLPIRNLGTSLKMKADRPLTTWGPPSAAPRSPTEGGSVPSPPTKVPLAAPDARLYNDRLVSLQQPRPLKSLHRSLNAGGLVPSSDQSPLKHHIPLMRVEQAGTIVVASPKDRRQGKLVALRQITDCSKSQLQRLKMTRHANLVLCQSAHHWGTSIYLLNEYHKHAVSLSSALSSPRGRLDFNDIKALLHGTLEGLKHLHTELQSRHGQINTHTILISQDGRVKLGKFPAPAHVEVLTRNELTGRRECCGQTRMTQNMT